MKRPVSKIRQEYLDEIKIIESNIKDAADGEAPQEILDYSQSKLDKLADKYQNNESIGNASYKLYELQALIYFYQRKDELSLEFIEQAIETRGSAYKRAENLIEQIQKEIDSSMPKRNAPSHATNELPLELQFFIKSTRTSAIIMAIISFISIYFIPWAVFYIVMATKLNPKELPNRKLIKAAAILTIPLCTALIPLFIDIEFWRMNGKLKRYEEKGSSEFKSDEEFLAAEPARKKRSVIAWSVLLSLIALFIILIIIASSSGNSSYNNTNTNGLIESGSNEVNGAYNRMENLRTQYEDCSSDLENRYNSLNTYSQYEVNTYNSDWDDCESTRVKLNNSVDEYNRLAGFE